MKILFCKISYMKYYKGVYNDRPSNGGSYVDEHGEGHEEYNFMPVLLNNIDTPKCMGFVETKSTNGTTRNQLHIEKINGCELAAKENRVDDVLVVWCATRDTNNAVIVGWYKHASVFRRYNDWTLHNEDGSEEYRCYNIIADAENCVLLPEPERNRFCWSAPVSKKRGFGFSKSLVWFAEDKNAEQYIERLLKSINEYNGENWIDAFPE